MSWCTSELPPLDRAHHDAEWGIPLHDDRRQFEYVSLEVMQCGLSWSLIVVSADQGLCADARLAGAVIIHHHRLFLDLLAACRWGGGSRAGRLREKPPSLAGKRKPARRGKGGGPAGLQKGMVRLAGFEPTTFSSGG